jgi:hypothetical protein
MPAPLRDLPVRGDVGAHTADRTAQAATERGRAVARAATRALTEDSVYEVTAAPGG